VTVPEDLDWVGRVLLGDDSGGILRTSVPAGYEPRSEYTALPSAARPYALLPTQRKLAAAAAEGLGNPVTWRLRAAEVLTVGGYRSGLLQRLRPERMVVSAPAGNGAAPSTLVDRFSELFGRSDLHLAVIIGSRRPNRKPVIKILDGDGSLLGFAKVGWNDVTRALVRNEGEVLASIAERTRSFRVPELVDHGAFGDVELLVMRPIPGAASFGASQAFPVEAAREIATLWPRRDEPLGTSAYRADLVERIAAFGDAPVASVAREAIDRLVARYGERPLAFGGWHGDFTPWNVTHGGAVLAIWDWERSGAIVPIGMDAARFDLDVRMKVKRQSPADAIAASVLSLGPTLEAMDASPGSATLVVTLHALEMVLRFEEARTAGFEGREPLYERALTAMVARLRSTGR
jgi:hypothetical protein